MLDNLVKDMYNVMLTKEYKVTPKEAEDIFAQQAELYKDLLKKISNDSYEPRLRLSMIGKADRQIYFELNSGYEKEPLLPHTLNKFSYGDVIELNTLLWAKLAGYKVENEQAEVEVEGVKGRIDCTINGVVVDVKSTSTYGFNKFKDGSIVTDDPFGYIAQLSAYHQGFKGGHKYAAFLAMDKQNGHLTVCKIPENKMIDAAARIRHIKEMLAKESMPSQCCGGTKLDKMGNTMLDVSCSYCPYKKTCHPNLRTFLYSNGPVYLTNVVKQPNVFELKDENK